MRRLRIGILDLVTKSPNPSLYGRLMNANLASIMPQVIGVWCEQEGHDVTLVCYTGPRGPARGAAAGPRRALRRRLHPVGAAGLRAEQPVPRSGARSRCSAGRTPGATRRTRASTSTTCSGSPTGASSRRCCGTASRTGRTARTSRPPHSRSSCPTLRRALEVHRGHARQGADDQDRADDRQPRLPLHLQLLHRLDGGLPAARLRGSAGRPGLPAHQDEEPDRRVARPQLRRAVRRLHGGGGGGGPAGAGCGTSPRAACRCCRSRISSGCRQNGFQAILPGIESWYDLGNKSKTRRTGMDKVQQVADHVNMILRYIPYIQTNFVLGLDGDMGAEPFELTKTLHRPGAGRLPRLLAALGVRPGGADEPRVPARRPRAARSRSTSSTTTTR